MDRGALSVTMAGQCIVILVAGMQGSSVSSWESSWGSPLQVRKHPAYILIVTIITHMYQHLPRIMGNSSTNFQQLIFFKVLDSITRLNIWQSYNYNDPLPIHMRYVSCAAGDDSLLECQFTRLANSAGCGHYEDVGLSCVPANSSLLPGRQSQLCKIMMMAQQKPNRVRWHLIFYR